MTAPARWAATPAAKAAGKAATPPAEENLPTTEMAATVRGRVHAEPCAHDGGRVR
ncbi:MAG TPA: hypothetical protein VHF92_16120 [Geodermatophilus sp.]|nr:hypothetical protein [Geodermatophilus sp.]